MKKNFKFLAVALLLIIFSCEKDNDIDNEISLTQELFNAPSIKSAQQFFDQNSIYTNTDGLQSRTTFNTLQTDWQNSKTKKYKETQETEVDILYTPVYINTNKNVKAFIASTEQDGIVESKIVITAHKNTNNTDGLSAYIFVYGLDGNLELEYNFENGQKIPFESNTNNGALSRGADCEELPSLDVDSIIQWFEQCAIQLDEIVITQTIDAGPSGGGGGGSEFSPWVQIDGLGYEDPNRIGGSGNPQVFVSNTVSANGYSISTVLGLPFGSIETNWLNQQAINNQALLNAIAEFLNNNKERSPDPAFENVDTNQLPEIKDEAKEIIIDYINLQRDIQSALSQNNPTTASQHLVNFIRLYGENDLEIVADYYESLIADFPTMSFGSQVKIYLSLKKIADDIPFQYFNAIANVYFSDLVLPILEYALFQATASVAIKILQRIPLPMILRGTRLNEMILKTTKLGEAGIVNSRLIPKSTVQKVEELFKMLTKDAISVAPSPTSPNVIVAQMGFGRKIVLRQSSTTVPEAFRVIQYQNFNTALGTSSYTLKFIP